MTPVIAAAFLNHMTCFFFPTASMALGGEHALQGRAGFPSVPLCDPAAAEVFAVFMLQPQLTISKVKQRLQSSHLAISHTAIVTRSTIFHGVILLAL